MLGNKVSNQKLFQLIFDSGDEAELQEVIDLHPDVFKQENWHALGGDRNNFSVVKNQQSNPIAALIEKITNSIDATLTRKCLEAGMEPESSEAPRSINEAVDRFFGSEKEDWAIDKFRREQAKNIQIVADGPTKSTSVIIYDNGEGQHPEKFEETFLSLMKGNKTKIHFVQGKYNMGGSGALVFCGKKRYQLIASKRYDNLGKFGFTLVREHPLSIEEQKTNRETWYEYLKIDDEIPSFEIDELNLGLFERNFTTGSVLKLYSYQFPAGYSGFAQELNQSINEYLFKPALPIYTVDKASRYPNNKVLSLDLFGLQRRLEKSDNEYVDDFFSWEFDNDLFGKSKVTAYVFKSKVKDQDAKSTKKNIARRFFKNNMSVIFSLNGQAHGYFTSEFITRSLKLNLLKSHLLIHVDCTEMNYDFRKELFMASRDRLKDGETTRSLRQFLAKELSKKDSALVEIEKKRKDFITSDSGDAKELLKSFTKNLPLDSDLMKLLNQTFKLELAGDKKTKKNNQKKKRQGKEKESFRPERFPTRMNLTIAEKDGIKAVSIPRGEERTITFDTDVENHYFDRIEEPGELKIALISYTSNEEGGGDHPPAPTKIEELFNINKSSPKEGKIRVSIHPKQMMNVGDDAEIKVTLTAPGGDFEELFWTKITAPQQKKEKVPKEEPEEPLGLPEFALVFKEKKEGQDHLSWEELEEQGISMDWNTVMYPLGKGESELERIFINIDSRVFQNFLKGYRNKGEEQYKIAENKYISSVYFHTLFLYTISKNRGYMISKKLEDRNEADTVDLGEYLRDIFDNYYSTFLLNYGGMEEMMTAVGD